jgi:hypothetical protein
MTPSYDKNILYLIESLYIDLASFWGHTLIILIHFVFLIALLVFSDECNQRF